MKSTEAELTLAPSAMSVTLAVKSTVLFISTMYAGRSASTTTSVTKPASMEIKVGGEGG